MGDRQSNKLSEILAAKFQYTIEISPDAVFWIERNGQFSFVNDQACRSLGYQREELLSLYLWDIDPHFPKSRWDHHWEKLKILGKINLETTHRRKDGIIFPVEVSAFQVLFQTKEFHAAFVRDITARKQAEEDIKKKETIYRLLFEYVPDGILVANKKSYYLDANPSMCKMLGYSYEELIGLHAADIVAPHEIEHIEPALKQIEETSEHFRVWLFKRKDESTFEAEVSVTKLPDSNLLALVRDISERKALEEQLIQVQKMESIGRLAGGIAHDFNNLLVPIIGYTELGIKMLAPDHKLYSHLNRVHESALRAATLTRQILAFSRKQVLEMRVLDLNSVINNFKSMIQRLIGEDVEVITSFEPDLYLIKADKGQMEQVLMNLAVNARDAMPTGGKLTIETVNVFLDQNGVGRHPSALAPGKYIMLSVNDTGCGMDIETQKMIFEPFFTTKGQGVGTGLGLSTTFGIVKQHNGDIFFSSELGKGTCFQIYLPQIEGEVEEESETLEHSASTDGTETILVVEDSESVRKYICETLESCGFRVIEAKDPKDALRHIVNKEEVHLLLTDVIMPEMNGRQLYENAASINPAIKVLYISGYTDNVISDHGILHKDESFLQKPFTVNLLIRKIRQILQ